jgi:hypothetical protein
MSECDGADISALYQLHINCGPKLLGFVPDKVIGLAGLITDLTRTTVDSTPSSADWMGTIVDSTSTPASSMS